MASPRSPERARSRRRAALGYVAALLASMHLLTATPARAQQYGAQPAGPDAVVLKDGGVIRGTLTEMIPGDHATLMLSTGQTATIRWDVIARVERGGVPMQAPTPATTAPSATPTPTTPAPVAAAPTGPQGNAIVHIDGESDLRLERQQGNAWSGVCNAPCDRELPLDGNYRIAGSGVRASHAFRLMATHPGEHVIISVDPASQGSFVGGIILISLGAPIALLGGFVLLIVAAIDAAPGHVNTGGAKVVGWSMFGLGGLGVVGGMAMMLGNSSTSVDQFNEGAKRALGQPILVGSDVLRVPTWHSAAAVPVPVAPVVPIWGARF